jgi:hypothetical protein
VYNKGNTFERMKTLDFIIETQGTSTFLSYEFSNYDDLDDLSVNMIKHNRIKGIFPLTFTQVDDKKYIKFNTSSKINVRQLLLEEITKERFINILYNLVSSIIDTEEYMIDRGYLLINPEYIFIDLTTNETFLICFPFKKHKNNNINLSAFFKTLTYNLKFNSQETCDYIAKIIAYLNSTNSFSIHDFFEVIEQEKENLYTLNPEKPVNSAPTYSQPYNPQQETISVDQNNIQPSFSPQQNTNTPPQVQTPSNNQPVQNQATSNKPIEKSNNKNEKPSFFQKLFKGKKNEGDSAKKEPASKVPAIAIPNQPQNNNLPFPTPAPVAATPQIQVKSPKKTKATKKNDAPVVQVNASSPSHTITPPLANNQPIQQVNQNTPPVSANNKPIINNQQPPFSNNPIPDFEESATMILDENEMTTNAILIRMKTNETINIYNETFKIGKDRNFVDYCISDNKAISRAHAYILNKNSNYYIFDNNSTNHTFVDGVKITSQQEVILKNGTKIKLANEEFEFKIF